jgi:tight adherence protein B
LLGCVVALASSLAGLPLPLVLAVAAAVVVVPRWRRRRAVRVHRGRLRAQSAEVVHALAAELRSGRPAHEALAAAAAHAGAHRDGLEAVVRRVQAGCSPVEEFRRVAREPGCEAFSAVAAAWEVTERSGGAVGAVFERLAAALDAEEESRRALEAGLAGPRATMAMLAVLPALGVVLGESAGAHPLQLLLHRPLGWLLLAGGGVLDGVGVLWVARLSRLPAPA